MMLARTLETAGTFHQIVEMVFVLKDSMFLTKLDC